MDIDITLTAPFSDSFVAQRAANSLDINIKEKLSHRIEVSGCDLNSEYSVGLIVGASGTGKTSIIKEMFGAESLDDELDPAKPVIDQFSDELNYEERQKSLSGVGLTSVPCWIRPAYTLSNGQKFRAEVALKLAKTSGTVVIDEWTSVVDRAVAKVMSHAIQKHIRRTGGKVVLCSCHYDVIDWLNPDWIIDLNKQEFVDRRHLWRSFQREEKLEFQVRKSSSSSWKAFSKYHYLSHRLPGGHCEYYGLFHGGDQIGFQCFANYAPWVDKSKRKIMHSNRVVIHPDYVGFGLGIRMTNVCAADMHRKGFDVMAKLSARPMVKARMRENSGWRLEKTEKVYKKVAGKRMSRKSGFRKFIRTYSFRWIGGESVPSAV